MMDQTDPYGNFRFRVARDGRIVAAFSVASASDDRRALTLERGICEDLGFERWAAGSSLLGAKSEPIDLTVEVHEGPPSHPAVWRLRGCRVAAWRAMPYMDETRRTAIRTLGLVCDDLDMET